MAKDTFQRTKPHVNVARQYLQQGGMSAAGVAQFLIGQIITDPGDRLRVAQLLVHAVSMSLPRVGWEVAVAFEDGDPDGAP